MKNLKKVLALVMAFAMAFTMFAGAVAFDDVQPGDDYSAAISMLSDLDVISGNGKGSYEPAKTITRAEACVLMANIMNGGKADTARFAGGSNFSDVAHGWWGESAIAYCVQNGITYGVGGGKFAPNREITDAEFVAMLTRAMGYDTATNPLSFPYGNYTAAVNNGLLDNVPYVEGSDCTKGEAAQMLYDALFADYARLTANLNVIHNADDHDNGATLIEDVFGLSRAANAEASKCTQHYWVITGESCEDEDVIFVAPIADKSGKADYSETIEIECTADVSALIGYKVVLWGETEHAGSSKTWELDVVKAVEVVDDQVAYDYNPTMADGDNDGELEELADLEVSKAQESNMNEKNGFSYVLIDWDNDGDVDYTNVTERYYAEVTSLTSKKVVVESGDTVYSIDLVDGECEWHDEDHDYVVELDDAAEEGSIVEITVDDAYETTLTISIEVVEPVTMTFTKWNSKGEYYFDGEEVVAAGDDEFDWVWEKVTFAKSELKKDFDLYLNANGYIVYEELVGSDSDGFLMILDSADGKHKNTEAKSTKASIEAMLTDGEVVDFDLAFDADWDQYDEDHYTLSAESNFVGGVYEYTLNDDGDIEELELATKDDDTGYKYDTKWNRLTLDNDGYYKYTGKSFTFVVEDDYVVEHEEDDGDLYVKASKVRALELADLPDIDPTTTVAGIVREGDAEVTTDLTAIYDGVAVAYTGDSASDDPDDIVKGAVLVVDDLDVLGEYDYIPALLTYVSYDGDVYTFTAAANGEYTDIVSVDADELEDIASAADAEVLEDLVDVDGDEIEWETIGYGLYVEFKLNDEGEIVNVEIMDAQATDAKGYIWYAGSHYAVVRGIVTELDDTDIAIVNGSKSTDGETIAQINYPLVNEITLDLADAIDYFTIDQAPAIEADKFANLNRGFADELDGNIAEGGDVIVSDYHKADKLDTYYFVDIVVDLDDTDEAIVIFVFDEEVVEEDADKIAEDAEDAAEALETAKEDAQAAIDAANQAWQVANAAKAQVEAKHSVYMESPNAETEAAYNEAVAFAAEKAAAFEAAYEAAVEAVEAYVELGGSETDLSIPEIPE